MKLRILRGREALFPPRRKGPEGLAPEVRGYPRRHPDAKVTTDKEGAAEFNFTPDRDGYYRVEWTSSQELTNETVSWRRQSRGLGVRSHNASTSSAIATQRADHRRQGHRTGRTNGAGHALVPENDRYVLFSVEAEDLFSYKLVHVTGTAKLIELPIEKSIFRMST